LEGARTLFQPVSADDVFLLGQVLGEWKHGCYKKKSLLTLICFYLKCESTMMLLCINRGQKSSQNV